MTWPAIPASEDRTPATASSFRNRKGAGPCLYVSLTNFTDQGIKNVRDTVRRAEDARGLIERHGGQLRLLLWTLGDYDQVAVVEFPDDETATAVLLQLGALGNIRTTTMKAFDAEQMRAIIGRTGYQPSADPDPGTTIFAGITGMAGADPPTGMSLG